MSLKAPVGTLIAFGGDIRSNDLKLEGWIPCDGGQYKIEDQDYAQLYNLIRASFGGDAQRFNVPDLRGQFIRGTDHGRKKDPDVATRTVAKPGGAKGDNVGSAQADATARPAVSAFVTSSAGDHAHTVGVVPDDYHNTAAAFPSAPDAMEWSGDTRTTSAAGTHSHTISTGGDAETRPANLYLFYLLKFRADASVPPESALTFPIGSIMPYAGDATKQDVADQLASEGWYPCFGQTFTAAAEDPLFQVIEYLYGGGDGKYKLPDLRGMFVRGASSTLKVATVQEFRTALPVSGSLVASEAGEHIHTITNVPQESYRSDWSLGHSNANATGRNTSDSKGAHTHVITGGGDLESRPLNVYLDFIIKYKELN